MQKSKEEIKANELIERFKPHVNDDWFDTKQNWELEKTQLANAITCAIICVDEIIKTIEFMSESDEPNKLPFWQSVKQILEAK